MTVIITAITPDGIIMAADSRLLSAPIKPDDPEPPYISSDQATKLYLLHNFNAGFSLTGPIILPHFILSEAIREIDQINYATFDELAGALTTKLSTATNVPFCFHLAGYFNYRPTIYKGIFHPLNGLTLQHENGRYCLFADGEYDLIKLITQYLQEGGWRIDGMTLLDAVDLVALLIQSQIEFSRFRAKLSPVGGPVDILVIKPEQSYFVAHKVLKLLSPDVSQFRIVAPNPT